MLFWEQQQTVAFMACPQVLLKLNINFYLDSVKKKKKVKKANKDNHLGLDIASAHIWVPLHFSVCG